jgi:hypothetical protein
MPYRLVTLAYGFIFMLGMTASAAAQDNGLQPPPARQQSEHIHTPRSIDQELDPFYYTQSLARVPAGVAAPNNRWTQ